jgi:hypothetical protein
MEYIIKAYSKSLNITQRELQLMGPQPTKLREAERLAESFARRLSQRRHQGAGDWIAQTEAVEATAYRTK